ncbi:Atpase Family Protein 2 [Manis pentadactyla]|nr:Atpase Family Protein 2 [Manis pentadactyla]
MVKGMWGGRACKDLYLRNKAFHAQLEFGECSPAGGFLKVCKVIAASLIAGNSIVSQMLKTNEIFGTQGFLPVDLRHGPLVAWSASASLCPCRDGSVYLEAFPTHNLKCCQSSCSFTIIKLAGETGF